VTQSTQAIDVGRPTLPDPITVPVATDFTISPAPVSPVSTLIDSSLLRIPESVGRSTELSRQRVFNLAELDHQPELVQSMNPVYPPELQGTNVYGIVVVHFIISAQGEIIRPEIVSTPHPALGAAVTRALARWRFKAGMKAGRAVSTAMELPVRFNLE
jgi:TonB family protein